MIKLYDQYRTSHQSELEWSMYRSFSLWYNIHAQSITLRHALTHMELKHSSQSKKNKWRPTPKQFGRSECMNE